MATGTRLFESLDFVTSLKMITFFIPTDLHSAEYEVFIQYFSQIVNSLSVQSLSAHFVAQNIISQEDQLEILSVTSPRKAVSFLLSRISSAVEAGVNESFYRFLDITEKYGSIDNRNISLAIKGKLLRCKESICKMKGNITVLLAGTVSVCNVRK